MKKSVILFLGFVVAISIILSSCSSDEDEPGQEAPPLPPRASFVADFGNFPQNENGRADQTKNNYGFAALNVLVWQSILTVDLAIPVAAFYGAFEHDFSYLSDQGKWKSEYTVNVASQPITAELFAESIEDGEKIRWEMYLSGNDFEDFLWFTGESRTDESGGDWVLYKSPDQPREILQISWERASGEAINSTYILTDTESDKEGSTIQYGKSEEVGFTHYYKVSITSESNSDYDLEISFNEETKVGRVRSEAWYQDALWHCWDENLDDVDC